MSDSPAELELREPEPALDPERALPAGVQPSPNYLAAIELGHVLAASDYFPDARDGAKAAVRIMLGMDLGLSPTAGLLGIHYFEDGGKPVFLIESKVLSALIKRHPRYDYKVVERSDEKCALQFTVDGEPIDDGLEGIVTFTIEDAKRAGLLGKDAWKKYPATMLTWRCMAEGQRLYFPDLTVGQPIYTVEEFGVEKDDLGIREALDPGAQPLTDEKAEKLRAEARGVYDSLRELNSERLLSGRFAQMVKNAEHSHEQLQNIVTVLTDMRDAEVKIVAAKVRLTELLGEPEAKPLIEAAERRPSQGERVEALEKAIAERGAEKGADDAED
jgi:hypothetical protein